jgi:gas vesicle protein
MARLGSFLSGGIIGGIIGAAITLLLTPSSGQDLRDQMQERVQEIQTNVKNAAATRRAELEQELVLLREPHKAE